MDTERSKLIYRLWLAWGGDDGDVSELETLIKLVVSVRLRALAFGAIERRRLETERDAALAEVERLRAATATLVQLAKHPVHDHWMDWSRRLARAADAVATAPLGHCARCHEPLNNVAPGFSVVRDGATVCAGCLKPGEEILRAR